eukprot:1156318-Pelagomonas_calceolata.AAC.6
MSHMITTLAHTLQAASTTGHVMHHLLGSSAVRHKTDTLDGDGCFSYVGGNDGLAHALRGCEFPRA